MFSWTFPTQSRHLPYNKTHSNITLLDKTLLHILLRLESLLRPHHPVLNSNHHLLSPNHPPLRPNKPLLRPNHPSLRPCPGIQPILGWVLVIIEQQVVSVQRIEVRTEYCFAGVWLKCDLMVCIDAQRHRDGVCYQITKNFKLLVFELVHREFRWKPFCRRGSEILPRCIVQPVLVLDSIVMEQQVGSVKRIEARTKYSLASVWLKCDLMVCIYAQRHRNGVIYGIRKYFAVIIVEQQLQRWKLWRQPVVRRQFKVILIP